MQNYCQLKQEFLKNWIKGLQACKFSSKNMGILEKKNAIKLSSDLAMALARRGRTCWSRSIIDKASERARNKQASTQRLSRSKKIMATRSHKASTSSYRKSLPNSIAKSLVRKRTQVLRRLLPGGDQCVDGVSLMRETLDYVMSLRAQIEVMRSCLDSATTEIANEN